MLIRLKDANGSMVHFRLQDFVGEVSTPEGKTKPDVQILRTGKFDHPIYGKFDITAPMLGEFKRNFDNRVRRQDISADFFHEPDDQPAAGWFRELYLKEQASVVELWGVVDWTPKATQMLTDKEVRYFSADFAFQWTDTELGVTYDNVLFGGGLVNRPFIKDMSPLVGLNEKGERMTLQELQAALAEANKKLGESTAKLADANGIVAAHALAMDNMKKKIEDLSGQLGAAQDAHKKLADAKDAMEKAAQCAEQEAKFAKLCTEGKACAAQKEAYLAGDMIKFAELSQPLNAGGAGNGGKGNETNTATLSEQEDKARALLGLTVEEWNKYSK